MQQTEIEYVTCVFHEMVQGGGALNAVPSENRQGLGRVQGQASAEVGFPEEAYLNILFTHGFQ